MEDEEISAFTSIEERREAIKDEAIELGRKMVDLVKEGKLSLEQSSVKDDTLFLSMGEGEGYFALTADQFGLTKDLSLDDLKPVPVPTVLGATEQMKEWVSRAEKKS